METTPGVSGVIAPLAHVALRDKILELSTQGEEAFYEIGVLCDTLDAKRMWEEAGYRTFHAYQKKELGSIPRTTLDRYTKLARTIRKEYVMRYGVSTLEKLMTYHGLVSEEPLPVDPGPYPVEVPSAGTQGVQARRFAECTRTQLEAAIRAKRKPKEPVPEAHQQVLTQLQEACDAVGETSEVKVTVQVEKGATYLTVTRIPIELLEQVGELMKAAGASEKASPKQAA